MSEGEGMIIQEPDTSQPQSDDGEASNNEYLLKGGLADLEGPGISEDTSKPNVPEEDQQ